MGIFIIDMFTKNEAYIVNRNFDRFVNLSSKTFNHFHFVDIYKAKISSVTNMFLVSVGTWEFFSPDMFTKTKAKIVNKNVANFINLLIKTINYFYFVEIFPQIMSYICVVLLYSACHGHCQFRNSKIRFNFVSM